MIRITDELSGTEAWRAVTALALLERAQRVAEHRSPLKLAERRLMWLLSDGRPRTMREIADDLSLEQSTVNRQVNAAIDSGLLTRSTASGQPAATVAPTEEGQRQFSASVRGHLDAHAAALEALPQGRRSEFLDLLRTFVDAYAGAVRS